MLTGAIAIAVIVVLILIGIILIGYFISIYNSLIRLKHNIDKAWANIDVLLKQRHDELTKLLETVKGYMGYEKDVLTAVPAIFCRLPWRSRRPTRPSASFLVECCRCPWYAI